MFPSDLSPSEREFAEVLNTAEGATWWHRNPVRKCDSVAPYKWNDGIEFFPDFVVGGAGRRMGAGTALAKLKGGHLLEYDRLKASRCGKAPLLTDPGRSCLEWPHAAVAYPSHLQQNQGNDRA